MCVRNALARPQAVLVEVGGGFTQTVGLTAAHWGISIGLAALSFPVGVVARLIPIKCVGSGKRAPALLFLYLSVRRAPLSHAPPPRAPPAAGTSRATSLVTCSTLAACRCAARVSICIRGCGHAQSKMRRAICVDMRARMRSYAYQNAHAPRARAWRCAFAHAVICISEYGGVHVDMHSRMRSYAYPNTAACRCARQAAGPPRRPARRRRLTRGPRDGRAPRR